MNRIVRILVFLSVAGMVACSWTGKKGFQCPGYVDDDTCADLRTAYDMTDDWSRDAYMEQLREQRKGNKEEPSAELVSEYPDQALHRPLARADVQPKPILRQAAPMRIWVAPYPDQKGRLHAPGEIYVQVEEPKWLFGDEFIRDSRVSMPLIRSQ